MVILIKKLPITLVSVRIPPNRSSAVHGFIFKKCWQNRTGCRTKKLATMNQQPDKLFREKLYNYQQPASSNAWSKVDAQLDKKNNKFLWLKVAAAILLLVVAAFILWPHNPDQTQVANTDVKRETQQPKNSKDTVVSPEKAS